MKPIVRVINEAIRSADAECLPCDRVNLDYDRHREYLDSDKHPVKDLSKTTSAFNEVRVRPTPRRWRDPCVNTECILHQMGADGLNRRRSTHEHMDAPKKSAAHFASESK